MPYPTFFNLPEDKRRQIVETLVDAFAKNDYQAVSVSQITDQAGISKGSFYQYFEDKADSYLYLIQLAVDEKMAFMQQVDSPDQPKDIFDNLRWLLNIGVSFEFSNPRLAQISYRAVFGDVPLPAETLALIREGGTAYFRQTVQQGIEAGTVREDIDPETAAFVFNTIFTNLGQYLIQSYQVDPTELKDSRTQAFAQEQIKAVMNQVIDVLENGFRKTTEKTI